MLFVQFDGESKITKFERPKQAIEKAKEPCQLRAKISYLKVVPKAGNQG